MTPVRITPDLLPMLFEDGIVPDSLDQWAALNTIRCHIIAHTASQGLTIDAQLHMGTEGTDIGMPPYSRGIIQDAFEHVMASDELFRELGLGKMKESM